MNLPLQKYNKLIAAVIVPAVVWGADYLGLPVPEDFAVQLTGVLTAIAVWWVPNKGGDVMAPQKA